MLGPVSGDRSCATDKMADRKLHADEIDIDSTVVRRLLTAQFPAWATLAIEPVRSAGTDNAIFRIGDDMAARLPRHQAAAAQVDKEQEWLPRLAPHLPFAVPAPLANGAAGQGYPWRWSICRWLSGASALEAAADPLRLAADLAAFVAALHRIDCGGGPAPGAHNFGRGVPLADRDAATRKAISSLHGLIDVHAADTAWEADRDSPTHSDAPVWIHGDLAAGNLIVAEGRLGGVIDFGGLAVGDPACDLIPAWNLFSGDARATYRAALASDDAAWARGRGWALSIALIQLPYYHDTSAVIAANARRVIDAVLADHAHA